MAGRRGQLVCQYLERISGKLLDRYPKVFREFARRRHGVYALYKKNRLYYVGLAKNLRGRLKQHLKDRHKRRWDRFSMYITLLPEHLKDLESLILRVARPTGNEQGGKFQHCENLDRDLRRRIREHRDMEDMELWGLQPQASDPSVLRTAKLTRYTRGKGFPIRWKFKGKVYKGRVRRDGFIRFQGKMFRSPSVAASSVTGRAMNGWWCWTYQRAPGEWVRLDTLRRR
jgi:hypothetical protein